MRVFGTGRGGPENWCEEVPPQITEMTRPMIEPVSWTIDEDLGQSVEVLCEGAARVPTVRCRPVDAMARYYVCWRDDTWNHAIIGDVFDRFCAAFG